jgi:hypothetical protein
MRVMLENGEADEVVKRRRMRDQDILDDRDLLMLSQRCQGRPSVEIGRMFRIRREFVWRRLNALPESVRDGMARLIRHKLSKEGVVFIAEQEMDVLKAVLRRERKKARRGRKRGQQVA